jgi:hypothetical protein
VEIILKQNTTKMFTFTSLPGKVMKLLILVTEYLKNMNKKFVFKVRDKTGRKKLPFVKKVKKKG